MPPSTKRSKPEAPTASQIHRRLLGAFGPQNWWPGESPFEILLGAILTQSVGWRGADRALGALHEAGPLTPSGLRSLGEEEVAERIRPARFFRQKARRIFGALDTIDRDEGGALDVLLARGADEARRRLLAMDGIGEETADSVLAYAGGYAQFVVDAYTRRIFARTGTSRGTDEEIRRLVTSELPGALALQEFHALIVHLGHRICRSRPRCPHCPLVAVCPTGWAVTLEGKGVTHEG